MVTSDASYAGSACAELILGLAERRARIGTVEHGAHEPGAEDLGEPQEALEVIGSDSLRAELDREAEVARGGCGVGELGFAHRLERRVVADLEEVDVERGVASKAPMRVSGSCDPVGVLPEERVAAEADHVADPWPPSALAQPRGGLVEYRAQAVASCANRPRKSPSTASPSSVSRPGPADPP